MLTSPTSRCPRCGHGSVRVALNLRVCQEAGCLTVFLVSVGAAQPKRKLHRPPPQKNALDIQRRGGKVKA